MPRTIIQIKNVKKRFGGINALKGVSFDVCEGEVVALLGHNGAGKSVMAQIISGVFPPSEGEILMEEKPVRFHSPIDARAARIETIYQTLALAQNLDAASNFFLGRELKNPFGFLKKRQMSKIAFEAICSLNPNFKNSNVNVSQLSGGERQAIAIARAVYFKAKLLVMDEPAAALGPHETEQVSHTIEVLKNQGMGILLISHDLNDVLRLADRVIVFKNGNLVGKASCKGLTQNKVMELMMSGRPIDEVA